jgi:hypothetical protein
MPKVNIRPNGENSPNLVTLLAKRNLHVLVCIGFMTMERLKKCLIWIPQEAL